MPVNKTLKKLTTQLTWLFLLVFAISGSLFGLQPSKGLASIIQHSQFKDSTDLFKCSLHGYFKIYNANLDSLSAENYMEIGDYTKYYITVKKDNGWGIINTHFQALTPFQFEEVRLLENGYAIVRDNGRYGVLRLNTGDTVLPFQYQTINLETSGILQVKKDQYWGVMDTAGNVLIKPSLDFISEVPQSEYILGKKGKDWVVMDKQGDVIWMNSGYRISTIHGDVMILEQNGQFALADVSGNIKTPFKYFIIEPLARKYFSATEHDGNKVILNAAGQQMTMPLDEIYYSKQGYFVSEDLGGTWSVMDTNFRVLFSDSLDFISNFIHGYMKIQKGENYGLLNNEMKVIMKPEYTDIHVFENNKAIAYDGNFYEYWDLKEGKTLIKNIEWANESDGDTFLAQKEGSYYVIGGNGAIHVKHKTNEAFCWGDTYIVARQGNGYHIFNSKGDVLLDSNWDRFKVMNDNYAIIRKNKKWGVLDDELKILMPPTLRRVKFVPEQYLLFKNEDRKIGLSTVNGKILLKPFYADIKPLRQY